MTYAGFLLLFLLLPFAILVAILRKRLLNRRYLTVVSILTLVALLYRTPWDHFATMLVQGFVLTWYGNKS